MGAIAGLVGAAVAGLIWLFVQMNTEPMGLLYSDLEPQDAARIVERLQQSKVPYEERGSGTVIYVPKSRVFDLRLEFASDGIPANGVVGYELFDKTDALGTTSFVQSVNHLRALEGELARTIAALGPVESARVHLVLPKRELFSRDKRDPTASIVLKTKRGRLNDAQIEGVRFLVSSAVEGLSPTRVSILDERGTLLANGAGGEGGAGLVSSAESRRAAYEDRLRRRVEEIVASMVGPDSVRVQVTAEMDFNRIVTESAIYDPERAVVVSTETIEESESSSERETAGGVSVGADLPEAQLDESDPAGSQAATNRVEERVNYQNSLTKQTEVLEAGRITRLSVAVVVNDRVTLNEDGSKTYTARTPEEVEQIGAIVRSSIGFSERRGDQVEILNQRFTELAVPEVAEITEPLLGLETADYLRYAEKLIFLIIASAIAFLVIRPLLSRLMNPPAAPAAVGAGAPALAAPGAAGPGAAAAGQAALPEGQAAAGALPAPSEAASPPAPITPVTSAIDVAQIEGQVKESSVKKVGEIVAQHPEETMSILRNWIYETH